MAGLLLNFRNTMILSIAIAILFVVGYGVHAGFGVTFWEATVRWVHVSFGILWIGLLYYFNFVQIRKMPDIPAELKPAISKYIAPEALFWFRYAALATWVAGIVLALLRSFTKTNFFMETITLGFYGGYDRAVDISYSMIGVGMWLATIMFINVWVFIWPNQKIALGLVDADADAKAKAARLATLFSRTNTLLSLPMLTTMAMNQTLFG
ncbi:MAG TPA: urate hydroxylase PuuD [Caulobacteraceae bacterium]|jgi:uncharacterized membrane protein|nr:urate hydroxylase PuuD [Caulobacteraceae bacterium]